MTSRSRLSKLLLVLSISVLFAVAAGGCGSSPDPALVKSAGEHGNALQANYTLLVKNELTKLDTSKLAIFDKASSPKSVSSSALRKAQADTEKQLATLTKFRRSLAATNVKLRRTPLPDFKKYLDASDEVTSFSDSYTKTTSITRRAGTVVLGATSVAISAYKELGDFIEKWQDYVAGGSAATFVSAGEASSAALTKMGKRLTALERQANIADDLDDLVGDMADDATDDSQLSDLITSLRDEYPNSFLPKHIVEKK